MSVKSTQGFNDFPVPVGSIITYAGSVEDGKMPLNYLICDGTSVLETEYPELFSVIGTTFGSVGAGEFSLPDLVGFCPKCATVAGVVSSTPTSSGVTFANLSLTEAELPSITGIAIGANINGGFPTGSSTSSTAKIDENDIGGGHPMTSWNTTSTVDMTSNSAPSFIYSNGTGAVAPIDFTLVGEDSFVIKSVEMVFLIKTKNHYFPN
jgi:microcystin-dependent protein